MTVFMSPSAYWSNYPTVQDDTLLRKEVASLPPLNKVSMYFLRRIIKTLVSYHKCFCAPTRSTLATDMAYQIAEVWGKAAQQHIEKSEYTWHTIASSMQAFGALRVQLPCACLSAIEKAAIQTFSQFDARDLSDIGYGFGLMRVIPSDGFADSYGKAIMEKLPTFTSWSLAYTLSSCAQMNIVLSEDLMLKAGEAIQQNQPVNRKDLVQYLWTMAIYSALPDKKHLPQSCAHQIVDMIEKGSQSLNVADYGSSYLSCLRLLPEKAHLFAPGNTRFSTIKSSTGRRFINALATYGILSDDTLTNLPLLRMKLDCAFKVGRQKIIIECDGPRHYMTKLGSGKQCMNGSTYLTTSLIRQYYPDTLFVRVPYFVTEVLEKKQYTDALEGLRDCLRYANPDAYTLTLNDGRIGLSPILHGTGSQQSLPDPARSSVQSPNSKSGLCYLEVK